MNTPRFSAMRRTILGSTLTVTAFFALFFGISGAGYELRRVPPGGNSALAATAPAALPVPPIGLSTGLVMQSPFVAISERMMPSVVNILTTQNIRRHPYGMPGDPWGNLFGFDGANEGGARDGVTARPMSLGTGFVIEASDGGGGLILTNHHVVAEADDVRIKFTEAQDEAESPAEIVGRDPELDIALLRVKTTRKLQAVSLGDSEALKVGEWIAAIGNPFGHGHSVSHGIVSAKARSLPGGFGRYLQVDAPINPGNSGGPLVNMNGEVVGINNAIDARGPGIGFAIPVNSVKALLAQLKSNGRVDRGYIGVNIAPLKPELARAIQAQNVPAGAPMIVAVMPGQPAARAGLQAYDVISKLNGQPIKSPEELMSAILLVPVGDKVQAEIVRNGKTMTIGVTVGRRPAPERA